jgi:hypothetical protein
MTRSQPPHLFGRIDQVGPGCHPVGEEPPTGPDGCDCQQVTPLRRIEDRPMKSAPRITAGSFGRPQVTSMTA